VQDGSALEAIIVAHSEALFGRSLTSSQFSVGTIATGTRQIYRVRPTDSRLPVIVGKARSPRVGEDSKMVFAQTEHEFAVHSAVSNAMVGAGVDHHSVPRPILALPKKGLLFMEQAPGDPVARWISRELLGLARSSDTDKRVRRCGDWLYTFACRASAVGQARQSETAEILLAAARANHHVYSLIGLSGSLLVEAMLAQVRRRLRAYRVAPRTTERIESTFSTVFRDFSGPRDIQGNVHGKFSIADVLISSDRVVAIDLEQAARGSLYLDPAYFLCQLCMITRWKPFGRDRRLSDLRKAFLAGRSPSGELDEQLLDAFVAYYLVNSLRPGGGLAGFTARAQASHWIDQWLGRVPA